MDSLIKAISSLPYPALSKDETEQAKRWEYFINLLDTLPAITSEEFQKALDIKKSHNEEILLIDTSEEFKKTLDIKKSLNEEIPLTDTSEEFKKELDKKKSLNEEIPLTDDNIKTLSCYLDKWNEFWIELQNWDKVCISTLQQTLKKTVISADELLPGTASLLPNDVKLLESIQEKLVFAYDISPNTEAGYYINNLKVAITIKLKQIEIARLKLLCLKALDALLDKFEKIFQSFSALDYEFYFKKTTKTKIEIIEEILSDIELCKTDGIESNAELKTTLDQFKAARDLLHTLTSDKHDIEHVFEEFDQKFMVYKDFLKDVLTLDENKENYVSSLVSTIKSYMPTTFMPPIPSLSNLSKISYLIWSDNNNNTPQGLLTFKDDSTQIQTSNKKQYT